MTDVVPGSQESGVSYSTRDALPGPERHVAVQLITQTNTKQMKSRGEKETATQFELQVPFYSQERL